MHLRRFVLGSKLGCVWFSIWFPVWEKDKKTRIFRLCFPTSQCPLCMDCLWTKATSLFGTAVLLTWSKGKASASGHYHYHFTIFLPACYMGFPLQIFFSIFCADWFILLMPGKISTGKCTRLMRKRRQLHSLLILKQLFLSVWGSCYFCGVG